MARTVGVRFPADAKIFSTLQRPDRLWGPSSLLYTGYGCSFAGVRRPGRQADRSLASSAQVESNEDIPPLLYTSSWRGFFFLIKHRDNFTFDLFYYFGL
jgi:hypothetical protein